MTLPVLPEAPSGSWSELSARAARNDKPAILMTAVVSGVLADPREIRKGLEDAWTTCEWPGRAADYDLWLSMFELALEDGHYLAETDLRPIEELPEMLTVYRAAASGHELGLSWTSSFERAHWFATRLGAIAGGPHRIHELDVPREQVLAHFHATREEHEFVIDTTPVLLDDLREVRPEEWEYLLAAPSPDKVRQPVLIGMRESVILQLEIIEARIAESPIVLFTRNEALGLIEASSDGLTADAIVAALDAVEALYAPEQPGMKHARNTLGHALRATKAKQ